MNFLGINGKLNVSIRISSSIFVEYPFMYNYHFLMFLFIQIYVSVVPKSTLFSDLLTLRTIQILFKICSDMKVIAYIII